MRGRLVPSRVIFTRIVILALAAVMTTEFVAGKEKRPAAAEYREQGGSVSLIHIDTFVPDEIAEKVAAAGHDGNPDAIRAALGELDCGFIKIGGHGYRIDYARRRSIDGGTQIVLLFRNEVPFSAHGSGKCHGASPIAAATVMIPDSGRGRAIIYSGATVTFRSVDDISIVDCGQGMATMIDLRPAVN